MNLSTKYRTDAPEIMDDFALEGLQLTNALDKIAQINQFLGGNALTLNGVEKLISEVPNEQIIKIIDLGCGNGDMLRTLADYAQKSERNFHLIGVDANAFTVNYAKECSSSYPNIEYLSKDIFELNFQNINFDIALCTLTLHHFKENDIVWIIKQLERNAKLGIVVNDLHRSKVAYRLFQLIAMVFNLNEMSKKDGLTSILRGFKKEELLAFSNNLKNSSSSIQWKWAYRYQWIITKL
ncbi:MAG: methyltransferase domain-containing protein [Flavobacterium sp.]|nr:methyltransferase domain-containing protein [Flavobacterium sp.]